MALLAQPASAKPEFERFFRAVMKPMPGTALGSAQCGVCHAGTPPILNPYGAHIRAALRASRSGMLTESILGRVAYRDSDRDGVTNNKELAAGTLPGDAGSRPGGKAAPGSARFAPSMSVPVHSFHPLIVHFPVALLIFGAVLEVAGARKSRPDLRSAGFLNISAAAAASLAAVATGLTALFRLGMPMSGVPLVHLCLGSTAAVAMILVAAVGFREKEGGRNTRLYWGLLGFAFFAVAVAGHFGSVLVFG